MTKHADLVISDNQELKPISKVPIHGLKRLLSLMEQICACRL